VTLRTESVYSASFFPVFIVWGEVLATRYSQGRWTDFDAKYTPKHAVPRKDVPFQGREHKF